MLLEFQKLKIPAFSENAESGITSLKSSLRKKFICQTQIQRKKMRSAIYFSTKHPKLTWPRKSTPRLCKKNTLSGRKESYQTIYEHVQKRAQESAKGRASHAVSSSSVCTRWQNIVCFWHLKTDKNFISSSKMQFSI